MNEDLYAISRCLAFFLRPEARANLALTCKVCCAAIRDAEKTQELVDEKRCVVQFKKERLALCPINKNEEWITRDARAVAFCSPALARGAMLNGDAQFAARIIDNVSEGIFRYLFLFAPQISSCSSANFTYTAQVIPTESYIRALLLCVRPRHTPFENMIDCCDSSVSLDILEVVARKFCRENFQKICGKYGKIATTKMETSRGCRCIPTALYAFLGREKLQEALISCEVDIKRLEKSVKGGGYLLDASSIVCLYEQRRNRAFLNFIKRDMAAHH